MTFFKNWRVYSLFEYKAGNYTYTCLTCGFRNASTRARNSPETARVGATLSNPASTADQRLAAAKEWVYRLAALTPYDGLNQNSPGGLRALARAEHHLHGPPSVASHDPARATSPDAERPQPRALDEVRRHRPRGERDRPSRWEADATRTISTPSIRSTCRSRVVSVFPSAWATEEAHMTTSRPSTRPTSSPPARPCW